MRARPRFRATLAAALALGCLAASGPALAQAKNPFSVGISEGGGSATGIMGWILAQQGSFEHSLSAAVRASKADGSAFWWLGALSFVYGVLHAAGPGHGKAVLASYMVASQRALKRGIVLSFLAALLQAFVAVALVGLLSLVYHATAIGMREGAAVVEKLSYLGVALLGSWLVWRKGKGLLTAWRLHEAPPVGRVETGSGAYAVAEWQVEAGRSPYRLGPVPTGRSAVSARRFACVSPDGVSPDGVSPDGESAHPTSAALAARHRHGPGCGHWHAPDPARLGDDFSWREAMSTVVAAGARPCSGAILVLVFALAQGVFAAGIAATVVMALGTAITTAALAATAVLAKGIALRLAGSEMGRGVLVAGALEVAAAFLVLAVGLSLLFGIGPLQALA